MTCFIRVATQRQVLLFSTMYNSFTNSTEIYVVLFSRIGQGYSNTTRTSEGEYRYVCLTAVIQPSRRLRVNTITNIFLAMTYSLHPHIQIIMQHHFRLIAGFIHLTVGFRNHQIYNAGLSF